MTWFLWAVAGALLGLLLGVIGAVVLVLIEKFGGLD